MKRLFSPSRGSLLTGLSLFLWEAFCILSVIGCAISEPQDENSSLGIGRVVVKGEGGLTPDTIYVRVEGGSLRYTVIPDGNGYFFIPNIPSEVSLRLSRLEFRLNDAWYSYDLKESEPIRVGRGQIKDLGHHRVSYGSKDGVSVRLGLSLGATTDLDGATLGVSISASIPLVPPPYEVVEEIAYDEVASLKYLIDRYPQSAWARKAKVQLESPGQED